MPKRWVRSRRFERNRGSGRRRRSHTPGRATWILQIQGWRACWSSTRTWLPGQLPLFQPDLDVLSIVARFDDRQWKLRAESGDHLGELEPLLVLVGQVVHHREWDPDFDVRRRAVFLLNRHAKGVG